MFYYSPTIAEEKTLVMNCYRIEMPEVEFDDEKQDYIDYYERIIKQVKIHYLIKFHILTLIC